MSISSKAIFNILAQSGIERNPEGYPEGAVTLLMETRPFYSLMSSTFEGAGAGDIRSTGRDENRPDGKFGLVFEGESAKNITRMKERAEAMEAAKSADKDAVPPRP